jgi:hypothetical protein
MTTTDHRAEAEWLTRMGRWGLRVLAVVLLLALAFTMVNVQQFSAGGASTWWWWCISWLLDPMASVTAAAAIVAEGLLADYNRPREPWLAATKWWALGCTWLMNIWDVAFTHFTPKGILLHSVAPGIVLLLAEAAPRVRRHFAEIRAELATAADTEDADSELTAALAEFEDLVTRTAPDPVDDAPAGDFPRVGGGWGAHPDTTGVDDATHPDPTPELELVPNPPPHPDDEFDPTILAAARALRDQRAEAGLTTGRRVLLAELPARLPAGFRVTDTTARQLARVLAA